MSCVCFTRVLKNACKNEIKTMISIIEILKKLFCMVISYITFFFSSLRKNTLGFFLLICGYIFSALTETMYHFSNEVPEHSAFGIVLTVLQKKILRNIFFTA